MPPATQTHQHPPHPALAPLSQTNLQGIALDDGLDWSNARASSKDQHLGVLLRRRQIQLESLPHGRADVKSAT